MGQILYTGGHVSYVVGRVLCAVGYILCAVVRVLCIVGRVLQTVSRVLGPVGRTLAPLAPYGACLCGLSILLHRGATKSVTCIIIFTTNILCVYMYAPLLFMYLIYLF